ncbi:MAG TPA: hypothetical protein IGR64_19120, partial [Leptolyngbyaceae cyanobacterium M65_K2018_010]|nr:hypothetical protein [Leptolyngbyaceae cyanobacterium M65_K2018_010]
MADKMAEDWLSRLQADYPDQPRSVCQAIVRWLLGNRPDRWEALTPEQLAVAQQSIEYRYRILQQRYWQTSPDRAYQTLVKRLSGLFLIRNKIRIWISLSRDRRRTVVDVVQEVIQEMMRSDRHLAQELEWIAGCSEN